jgi:hypothetical protein
VKVILVTNGLLKGKDESLFAISIFLMKFGIVLPQSVTDSNEMSQNQCSKSHALLPLTYFGLHFYMMDTVWYERCS